MTLVLEKQCQLVCLVLLHYTFHCMTEVWFFTESNAICQFYWGPIHCDDSHAMPVKASDCSASITRNMVTLQSPLNTLCNLTFQLVGLHTSELSIRYQNLLLNLRDHHRKMRFQYNDTKFQLNWLNQIHFLLFVGGPLVYNYILVGSPVLENCPLFCVLQT